ncbi:MAG: hypothetical protein JWO83_1749 [Caulobacteraceae bacterium]|nr:hypothetical protein [Caulobacteraceae bacterium]
MSLYSEIDLPHRPSDHPEWQESWVLIFRDPLSGAVGFLRTGSYVNQGTTQTHWGMALPDGTRFRRHLLDRKLEPGDRTETSASSGSMKYSIPNMEYARFEGNDVDAEADLRIYDWFPSQDWSFIGGPMHGKELGTVSGADQDTMGSSGHPESAGRVEGRVRIGDRVFDIENGLGYRDHGFGPRPHAVFRSARWHAGTVGPNLSYSLVSMHDNAGDFHKFGWVMLGGKREAIRDMHTVSSTLGDGYSVVGGWSAVRLENGQTLRINVDAVDGVVTSTHLDNGGPGSSPAGIEVLSIPRWNGQSGVCDFNMIDNPHRGEQEVSNLFLANHESGLSKRAFDASWIR